MNLPEDIFHKPSHFPRRSPHVFPGSPDGLPRGYIPEDNHFSVGNNATKWSNVPSQGRGTRAKSTAGAFASTWSVWKKTPNGQGVKYWGSCGIQTWIKPQIFGELGKSLGNIRAIRSYPFNWHYFSAHKTGITNRYPSQITGKPIR